MNKRPSFQFYPGDWVRDNVSGCSLAAQGLWLRLMVVMHDSERYGYLATNGAPIPDEVLARKCGATLEEYRVLLTELDAAGVPSRIDNGIIYSRRMVRDERDRAQNRDYVQRSRVKGGCKDDVRSLSDPSSSSPSSSEKQKTPRKPPLGFAPPTLQDVKDFMKNDKWAEDFFDYFQSNGWKVGGRAPMKDWQAAARRWKRTEEARAPKSNGRSAAPPDGKKACWVCQKLVAEREYRAHVDICMEKNRARIPEGGLLKSFDALVASTAKTGGSS